MCLDEWNKEGKIADSQCKQVHTARRANTPGVREIRVLPTLEGQRLKVKKSRRIEGRKERRIHLGNPWPFLEVCVEVFVAILYIAMSGLIA